MENIQNNSTVANAKLVAQIMELMDKDFRLQCKHKTQIAAAANQKRIHRFYTQKRRDYII